MPDVSTSSPYAPPTARIGDLEMLAGYDGTGKFSIGLCVREAWASVLRNVVPFLGLGALLMLGGVGAMTLVVLLLPVSLILGISVLLLLYLLSLPVLAWGFFRFSLSAIDGRARIGELFAIFERFWPRLGKMVLLYIVVSLVALPGSIPQSLAQGSENRWLVGLSWVWLVLWSLAVSTRLSLAFYFVVDREMRVLDALQASWAWTRGNVLRFVGLLAVSLGIAIGGVIAFGVGLIPASLVIAQMWPSAFRQIVGRAGPATATSGA